MQKLEVLAQALASLLRVRGKIVAVAESSCEGLICGTLLSVQGASAYFTGGGSVYVGTTTREITGHFRSS